MRTVANYDNGPVELNIGADEPGPGGASHNYYITTPNHTRVSHKIKFQQGAVEEVGVNGVTMEALLSICVDRLDGFQAGEFACAENQRARDAIVSAIHNLNLRTAERISRGVEGKSIP